MSTGRFTIVGRDDQTRARAGELVTAHGIVHTPTFMPVGTAGSVKGLAPWELQRLAPEMVLANTYHLFLRPGIDTIEKLGGLHRFMGFSGPILTDSGGFQIFSLSNRCSWHEEGVVFRSHIDGAEVKLTPEIAVDVQRRMGVDVAMALDVCPALPASKPEIERAVAMTSQWAARCRAALPPGGPTMLFGIVQGGLDVELRQRSADDLVSIGFDGYALGGFSVGEPPEQMWGSVDMCAPMLPDQQPRYLMGVGLPRDIINAVASGIDLFDCVIPTRNARNGLLHTSQGRVVLKNARWKNSDEPPDPACDCPTCRCCSLGFLRHLYLANESAVVVLATVHNLHFYLSLLRSVRWAIMTGRFAALQQESVAAGGWEKSSEG